MEIKLKCESKLAYDSPDHIFPKGTATVSGKNQRFNWKVYNLLNREKRQLNVLDLGCSGGGFIRDCINDGCLGIGLEGSDYSQKLKRAEWAIIPEFLFTCDISKNFQLFKDNKLIKFDLITAWEVLEHPKEEVIGKVIQNIKDNLKEDGIFIASISNSSDISSDGTELHQCIKPKEWWIKKFEKQGLYERKELYNYFNTQWIRGRKETNENFHIIFSKGDREFKNIKRNLRERFEDFWIGSRCQRMLELLITGRLKYG